MRIAHFVTLDCSQDHAGTGRPGTRQGPLGALDGMSRPSRLPAPRSQHIGTERPARNNAAPKSKNTNAPSTRVMQIVGAWPTIPDNMTELPRRSSVGLRGGQPGGCTFHRDRPYRPPHPAIWWPGQSLQPPKTHTPPREAARKQGLERFPGRGPPPDAF